MEELIENLENDTFLFFSIIFSTRSDVIFPVIAVKESELYYWEYLCLLVIALQQNIKSDLCYSLLSVLCEEK